MSVKEPAVSENGAAAKHRIGPRSRARGVLCVASLAILFAFAFPALASAVTSTPLLTGVSATPSSTGANLNATIYPYGLDTHYRFEYGTTAAYGTSVPVPDADIGSAAYPGTVPVTQAIAGLSPGTIYHYRIVASNSLGSASGPEAGDKIFTTAATPPSVASNSATAIAGGFELSGTVNPQGTATAYRFEYGMTTAYGTNVPVPDASVGSGSTDQAVSQAVTGLLPNTTYHFRLAASHSAGPLATTADRTFTTPPSGPAPPSAVVSPAIQTATGFKLEGAINPNGVETGYHFEFGASTLYGENLPEPDADIGAGESAVAVSQEVTGLAPNTTYHYRVVANNAEGPGTSPDQAFTTPPNPPVVVSLPFGESAAGFSLNGTVNPNGGATTYHFEFGITAAYGSSIPASDVEAGSGTSPVAVTQLVTGLPPNVPYHYRLVAHNAGGTMIGGDEEFVTPAAAGVPESPSQVLVPSPPGPVAPAPGAAATNRFTLGKAQLKGGTATLQVDVPGPGTVSASGAHLKAVTTRAKGAGPVALKLKLTSAGLKALHRSKGKRLQVKIAIVFQPSGGSASTESRTVVFKT